MLRDPLVHPARQGGRRNANPGPAPNVAADPGLRAGVDLSQNPAQNLLFSAFFYFGAVSSKKIRRAAIPCFALQAGRGTFLGAARAIKF